MIMAFLLFAFVSTSALPQRPTALLQPGHNSTVGSDNLGLSESVFLASSAQEGTYFPCERQKKHCESWCAKASAPWTSKWCARLALLPLLRRGTVPTTAHPRFMDALWMPVPSLAAPGTRPAPAARRAPPSRRSATPGASGSRARPRGTRPARPPSATVSPCPTLVPSPHHCGGRPD